MGKASSGSSGRLTTDSFSSSDVTPNPEGSSCGGQGRRPRAFKAHTLREIARTAPYMHDGSVATLEAVVEFYDGGGRRNPHVDPELRPLRLSAEEKQVLIVFLRSLTGRVREGSP
ncbi:MAG: hypothetical protein A3H97_00685 [Acidobacteria bacterium RIFCSPLOWO2_02_FULL_65_29]|nr:MAG: hypothetical protein A3H97_00685 [Acidobacteria bacterium RIFCSPLOWO2_02_FULL_65_29]